MAGKPRHGGGIPGQLYGGKPHDCGTCNQTHPRGCRAHRKHLVPLTPCMQMPVTGSTVCRVHGGNAKQVKGKGRERAVGEQMAKVARKLIPDADDREPINNPLEKLLELAGEADAFREGLRLLVNQIGDRIRYESDTSSEQLRAEVSVYRAALRDVTDMLVAIAKLDIDARLARMTETQGRQVVAFLDAVMVELGHQPRDAAVAQAYERHLHLIA